MNLEKIQLFKSRLIKAKSIFEIKKIDKKVAYDFIKKYHYLGDAKFFSFHSYGLYLEDDLVGVTTFSNPQGNVALKGWFGLENQDKSVLELSRLCMNPELNQSNATSYLLSNSIKLLKKEGIRAVITLAESTRHVGSIYQVCNFKCYGLTDKKSDFYRIDGKKNPRGSTKEVRGVWTPRSRKYRYAFILDKKLKCNYEETNSPSLIDLKNLENCCKENVVYDNRFNEYYTCPICTGQLELIK